MKETDLPEIAAKVIEDYIDRLCASAVGFFKRMTNSVRVRIKTAFSGYLTSATTRYSKAKTLIFRDAPVYLYDFYVPIDLKNRKDTIAEPSLSKLLELSNHVLVTGGGGTGKSMLMRHLFLDTAASRQTIPVYLELRDLNGTDNTIVGLIEKVLNIHKFKLPSEYLLKAMELGHFAFFLDGFDEVDPDEAERIQGDLLDLSNRYDENIFVVTSRPGREFTAWERFHHLTAAPLTCEKAVAIIRRLQYATDIKERFIEELEGSLFERHKSFLSNPLLLTIMLLTYRDNADIPSKLHLFYAQAFDALYSKHDAAKPGGFSRKLHSDLPADDFRTVLAAYSMLSYGDSKYSFTRPEVKSYLVNASMITGLSFKTPMYLKDLLESVCMLVREGTTFTYSHRSFQEYFSALFISQAPLDVQRKLLDSVVGRTVSDNVLGLLHEMDHSLVEEILIIPFLRQIRDETKYSGRINNTNFLRFLCMMFDDVMMGPNESVAFGISNWRIYHLLFFVTKAYDHGFQRLELERYETFSAAWIEYAKRRDADNWMSYRMPIGNLRRYPKLLALCRASGWWSDTLFTWLMALLDRLVSEHESRHDSIRSILLATTDTPTT